MLYPTSWPSSTSISSATRCATDMAATRRGCVQATIFAFSCGRSSKSTNCGICVVFPDPVSPTKTRICDCWYSSRNSLRCWCTGKPRRVLRMLKYLLESGRPVKALLGPSSALFACAVVVAWRLKPWSPAPVPLLYALLTGFSSFQCARYGFAAGAILPSPLDSVLTRLTRALSSSSNSRLVVAVILARCRLSCLRVNVAVTQCSRKSYAPAELAPLPPSSSLARSTTRCQAPDNIHTQHVANILSPPSGGSLAYHISLLCDQVPPSLSCAALLPDLLTPRGSPQLFNFSLSNYFPESLQEHIFPLL
jgi:hypothetical protein